MAETIFRAEKLVKRYRRFQLSTLKIGTCHALSKVDMEIRRGDIYGFVGKNGAGKTTLIRILAGLAAPTSGEMELFGERDPKALCRQRSRLSGIIESPAFQPGLTAQDNLEICRLQRGIEDRGCIHRALETVGLRESDIRSVKVRNFSLGMKQRLGIAMSLIGNPELLFFDEPLNGLDPVGIRDFQDLAKRLNSEHGITILISSHQLDKLGGVASCYGFIHDGKMIEQISAGELEKKVKKFILVRVDDTSGAEKVLRSVFGIARLEVAAGNSIRVYEQQDRSGEMMKALVEEGIEVLEMTVKSETLEKYYLSLIKDR